MSGIEAQIGPVTDLTKRQQMRQSMDKVIGLEQHLDDLADLIRGGVPHPEVKENTKNGTEPSLIETIDDLNETVRNRCDSMHETLSGLITELN